MNFMNRNCIKNITIRNFLAVLAALLVISSMSAVLFGFVVTKKITLIDGEEIQVTTGRMYVEELLAEQGIVLGTGDRVSVPLDTVLKNNDRIEITRAKKIMLTVDGETSAIYSCEAVLKVALYDAGVIMNQYDEIEPNLETIVTDGMSVQIFRVAVLEETCSEAIVKNVVTRPNLNKPASYSQVIEEGWNGAASVTYRVVTRDGVEIVREEVSRTVLWEPCNQIIEKGVQGAKVVAASTDELQVKTVLTCSATAYDASPASNGIYAGRTATGRTPAYGVVAVDPRVIPLGSKLYIEAADGSWVYGYAIAGDTGGAIKGNKIDLFFNTAAECRSFGRRQAKVYVLE